MPAHYPSSAAFKRSREPFGRKTRWWIFCVHPIIDASESRNHLFSRYDVAVTNQHYFCNTVVWNVHLMIYTSVCRFRKIPYSIIDGILDLLIFLDGCAVSKVFTSTSYGRDSIHGKLKIWYIKRYNRQNYTENHNQLSMQERPSRKR